MKLNKYIWLASLPMLLSACQEDALVDNPLVQGSKFVIKASVSEEGSFSRAQIKLKEQEDGRKYGAFQWDEGDKLRMYEITGDGENSTISAMHDFEISGYSNTSPSTSATFVSETTPTDGTRFYAYYPLIDANEDGQTITMVLDSILTDNTADSWNEYFNKNMYMMAEGEIRGAETALYFQHRCGLINVSYTNESGSSKFVKGISLDGKWSTSRKVYINRPWSCIEEKLDEDGYGISFEKPVEVVAGAEENFFILFMQPNGEAKKMSKLSIVYSDESNSSTETKTTDSYTVGMPTFFTGDGYRLNVKHTAENELVWAKAPAVEGYKVSTPDALVAALVNQTKIALGANIALKSTLMIDKDITLDLAGFKLTNDEADLTGFSKEKALIVVKRGAHLTINDASGMNTGVIEPYSYDEDSLTTTIKMVSVDDTGDELAQLTVNAGFLEGHHTIAGTQGKGNTKIVINGGDIRAGNNGGIGIIHPQNGILQINGGEITGGPAAIEIGAGNIEIKGGRIYQNKSGGEKAIALYISQGSDNLPLDVTIEENAQIECFDTQSDWNGAYAIYDDSNNENVTISINGTESNYLNGITGHIYSKKKRVFIGSHTGFNSPSALSYIAAGAKNVHVDLENRYGDYHGPAACIPDSEAENGAEVYVNLNGKTWTIESAADNNYFYVGKNNSLQLENGTICVPEDAIGVSLIKANQATLNMNHMTINSANVHYAVNVENGKTRFQNGEINAGDGCYAFNIWSSGLDKNEPMFDLMNNNDIHGNFKISVDKLLDSTESFRAHILYIDNTTIDGDLFVSKNITNEWLYYCVNRDENVKISDGCKGWDSVQNATDENLPALPVYITDPDWITVIEENYYGTDPYKEPSFNKTDEGYIDVNDETNKSIIEGMIRIAFNSDTDYTDIQELQCIEKFVNLKYLDVFNTSIDSLNLSQNTLLENVYVSGNKLKKFILDDLKQLITLSCEDDYLEVVPSTNGCTSLETLSLDMSKLTQLNLSNCQSLKNLHLTETPIQGTLDLRAVTLLEKLEVWNGTFTSIDLSLNAKLKEMTLGGTQELTSLNITGCPLLTKVEFSYSNYYYKLASLNAENCVGLQEVQIRNNDVQMEVNLNGCTSLNNVWLNNCKTLSLNGCTSLLSLNCSKSPALTELNLSSCSNLTYLNCQFTGLTSLDVTGLTLLQDLTCSYCSINEISGLESGLNNLEYLFCDDNNLNSINVKSLPALMTLECGSNNITTLDVSGLTNLTSINYLEAPVTTLNVSGCTALESLFLQAGLKNLDITGCTNLSSLNEDTGGEVQMETVKLDTMHDTFFQGTKYLWGVKDSNIYKVEDGHKQGYQYPVFTYSSSTAE